MDEFKKRLSCFRSRRVIIRHNNKILKEGVFSDWKSQPFFLEVFIETDKRLEKLKLMYPFDHEWYGDDVLESPMELYLDYRLHTLNKNIGTEFTVDELGEFPFHKFTDTIISICQV